MSYVLGAVPDAAAAASIANMTARIQGLPGRARALANEIYANTGFLSRGAQAEWGNTFVMQVTEMCNRVTVPGADGQPAWLKNPKLVDVIANFVESEAQSQKSSRDELLTFAGTARQISQEAGRVAAAVGKAVVEGAFEGGGALGGSSMVLVGGLALALAAAYIWRAFK